MVSSANDTDAVACERPGRTPTARDAARKLRKDLRTLALFIRLYCDGQHAAEEKSIVTMRTVDVAAVHGRPVLLCAQCRKLLQYSFTMRMRCPYDPKPACKRCPAHCYAPSYRAQIRAVMRYSGRRLVLSGRLDYLIHLLF